MFSLINNLLLFLRNEVNSSVWLLSSGIHDSVLRSHQSMDAGNGNRDAGSQYKIYPESDSI